MDNKYGIESIVGDFKDGKPHGLVKMAFYNDSMYIGKFHLGVRHGFFRLWENGRLTDVGYHFNGKTIHKRWKIHHGNKLYFDLDQNDAQTVLITNDGKITSGK